MAPNMVADLRGPDKGPKGPGRSTVNEHIDPLYRQAGRGVVHVGYHFLNQETIYDRRE